MYVPARFWTSVETEEVIKSTEIHIDASDPVAVEIHQKKTALKRRAVATRELPCQIISQVHATTSTATAGRLECDKALARIIQRARERTGAPNSVLHTRAQIEIPYELSVYESAPGLTEQFLLGDSGEEDPERIFIFGREEPQNWIHTVQNIYVDGTFSLAPEFFAQICVILAERPGCVTPVAYAPLPNKSRPTYVKMIELLRQKWPNFQPTAISVDFEISLINAFREVFPQAEIRGCFFHLTQSVKRKVQEEGLQTRCRDADFAHSAPG